MNTWEHNRSRDAREGLTIAAEIAAALQPLDYARRGKVIETLWRWGVLDPRTLQWVPRDQPGEGKP